MAEECEDLSRSLQAQPETIDDVMSQFLPTKWPSGETKEPVRIVSGFAAIWRVLAALDADLAGLGVLTGFRRLRVWR